MSVPITKGEYSAIETWCYSYLTSTMGLNNAAACGVLANISKESGFNTMASGDSGTSFGLCQWRSSRLTNLKNYCKDNGLSYMDHKGQLAFLAYELEKSYPAAWIILQTIPNDQIGAYDAAAYFCAYYEVPAGYGQWVNGELVLGNTSKSRGTLAAHTYWPEYSKLTPTSTKPVVNKGNLIVEEAKKHLGKPYKWSAAGPDSFDCSGFVYYVYKTAIGYPWGRLNAYSQWKKYGRYVNKESLAAGDLLFFKDTYYTGRSPNISHVGIATGNGDEFIQASGSDGDPINISNLSNSYWSSKFYQAKRLLDDSETGSGSSASGGLSGIEAALSISNVDNYLEVARSAISSLQEADKSDDSNWDYGYLVDLTNGGEFKFHVPEFSESISANWDDMTIIGRSTSIKAYNSTQSRSIDISLQLVAGIGFYSDTSKDCIDLMLRDVEFVKSLEYPDYSKSVVLPPATVLLYLNPNVKLRGVVTQVRADYKKPYDNQNRPMICELSFTVVQVTNSPPDYADIRKRTEYSY